ncbi:xaa-Pro aminopeptidase 1-like isoform X1 [Centruroides sculpturatus]|uniref:xaa-Pro aminopeptidase 1-like isoform X1 n=2 Tax=Centruroides sculpturatus TaxID=218467 RepID=UPI000C6E14E1|nr:xaa-Pro aminopeptidase 1-like isoform X1 [Centruroides sculpturatus]
MPRKKRAASSRGAYERDRKRKKASVENEHEEEREDRLSFVSSAAGHPGDDEIETPHPKNTTDKYKMRNTFNSKIRKKYRFSDMAVKNTTAILNRLRSVMKNTSYVNEILHAYIVPSGDAHQSEYIAAPDKRREYVSNFSGSAGVAVITEEKAALWTDGRYFLQAEKELDSNWLLMKDGITGTPTQGEWLAKVLPCGGRVGVDPSLISYDSWKPLATHLAHSGHKLVPIQQNLIDVIWENKPSYPVKVIEPLPLSFAGKSWESKVSEVREEMTQKESSILVVTALDEIAWLLNLRGSDIDYNPVFFSYVLLTMDSIYLFIDSEKCTSDVHRHLQSTSGNRVKITMQPYNAIRDTLSTLLSQQTGKVWISNTSSYSLVSLVPENQRIDSPNPILLKKAIKNDTEIKCMNKAQVKDAVAVCEFFAWLEKEIAMNEVTELSAAAKLEEFRKEQENFVGLSFETISASGPNGAIIHYTPSKETNRVINIDEIYLCDSGGQYKDGTTDITRAWHFGTPSMFEKECYTRVVKGHISIASAIFPKLTKGQMLDTLARKALWDAGLDYLHGTGHGVGSYLNVHEGPMGISWKYRPDDPGLQEGMVLSNEPGYYEDGQFGIRIESLMIVKKADTKYNFKELDFLTFEIITLVPIQTKLLEPSMLTAEEFEWLDNYHQLCRDVIGKELKRQGKLQAHQWLLKETQPLG